MKSHEMLQVVNLMLNMEIIADISGLYIVHGKYSTKSLLVTINQTQTQLIKLMITIGLF